MVISTLRRLVLALFGLMRGFRRPRRALPPARVLPAVPEECPACNGALGTDDAGVTYYCVGVIGRAAVEARQARHGSALRLVGVTSVPPCGWRGRGADYGTLWA